MTGIILSYAAFFLIAIGIGFAAGAALYRAAMSPHLADLDGDVQALRVKVSEARSGQDGE